MSPLFRSVRVIHRGVRVVGVWWPGVGLAPTKAKPSRLQRDPFAARAPRLVCEKGPL